MLVYFMTRFELEYVSLRQTVNWVKVRRFVPVLETALLLLFYPQELKIPGVKKSIHLFL